MNIFSSMRLLLSHFIQTKSLEQKFKFASEQTSYLQFFSTFYTTLKIKY